uniref:NIT2 n=1 Tax=Arundo donax TaxID=35708 RepID=A0A0A9BBZ6_ARUDO
MVHSWLCFRKLS